VKKFIPVVEPVSASSFFVRQEADGTFVPAAIINQNWSRSGRTMHHGFVEVGEDIFRAIRVDYLSTLKGGDMDLAVAVFAHDRHGADLFSSDGPLSAYDIMGLYIPREIDTALREARIARANRNFKEVTEICQAASRPGDRQMFLAIRGRSRYAENGDYLPIHISELRGSKEIVEYKGQLYYQFRGDWYQMESNGEWATLSRSPSHQEMLDKGEVDNEVIEVD